ncbi:Gfo/Idh/MocA family protein [Blastococcus sp. Marseille-P5729]|uniref:Gfo/Idh/MocA family protein n=1 Tax=Blastococcus sp. Marseille-P5729 TaxID=2086582 RepID=UPI000D112121|nr:Gfo/Idh/MocA family oxidoreductase [Blastococcus sp. Marseille-P5729]
MANLKAGLIGLGSMGRNHARNLHALDGVDFVGVCDPAGDPAGAAGAAPVFGSIEQLLALDPDYVVCAAPTAAHGELAEQLASAGVHMLVEKPVARDSATANAMVERFEKAGLIGAVGHIERFNPALQQLQKRLSAGDLGEIYQIATRRQGPFPARIADVGVVMDLASHDIDSVGFVTGREFQAVSARTAHKSGREHEDLVAVTGQLEGDLVANVLVNWLSPKKERVTVVTGEKGTFEASTLEGDLTFYANGTVESQWQDVAHFRGMTEGDVTRFAFPKPEPLRTEHEVFRDAVMGKESAIVTLKLGLTAVAVGEAIRESARTGKTINVETRR